MYYPSQENVASIAWMFAPAAIAWISLHKADIWWLYWYIKCMTLARMARLYAACQAAVNPTFNPSPTQPTSTQAEDAAKLTRNYLSPDQLYETKYIDTFRQFTNAYKPGGTEENRNVIDVDAASTGDDDWIKQKRDSLMRNYIIEYTPIGNCVMRFNNKLNTFEYFSDRVMPYRILESIGQKYVMTYFCKPIYIDLKQAVEDAAERKQKLAANPAAIQHIQKLEKSRMRRAANLKEIISASAGGPNGKLPAAASRGCEITPQQRQLLELNAIYHGIKIGSNSYTHKGKFAEFSVFPGGPQDTITNNNCVLRRPGNASTRTGKCEPNGSDSSAITFTQFKRMQRNELA